MGNPTRRAVIAGGLASTAGLVSASPASASEAAETSQVLAGTGIGSSTYDPPLTAVEQEVALQSDTLFVPVLPCVGNLLLALTSDSVTGTIRTACTGGLSSPDLNGVLKWSDLSRSTYTVDSVTGERVNGHLMLHAVGTITDGHYNGGRVDRFECRLSNQLSACLGGDPVTGTTGSVVLAVTMP